MIRTAHHGAAALGMVFALALTAGVHAQSVIDSSYYQARASELIGKTVSNRLDQKIGTVDDLLIASDGRVSHMVLSVGEFLGIGDKLVAVPYGEVKSQGNAVLFDRTAEQLKAQPEFRYRQEALNTTGTRDEYMQEVDKRMNDWGNRVSNWKRTAKDRSAQASRKLDDAWAATKDKFGDLKNATADGWDRAKSNFEKAWNDLEHAWRDASS